MVRSNGNEFHLASVDKVFNAKNNFCLAIPYRKIGRKKWSEKSEIMENFFLGKTQTQSFYF
jgi:hypothetical protein